jgi:hypothetical protein
VLSGEAAHTNYSLWFDPLPALEPTIYHIRDKHPRSTTFETSTHDLPHSRQAPTIYHIRNKHANHYTIDTVQEEGDFTINLR